MDRYQRVEKPKAETQIDENEIRITSQGRMRNYITYAMTLLQEKGSTEIVFKAMGRAINKTVTIVELIKRRIVGLYQVTSIGSTDITDTWEPLEEGLLPFQPPLPADQVKASTEFDYEGGNGYAAAEYEDGGWDRNRGYSRGRGRGGGRNFHGRGRGGYSGPQVDPQLDARSYNQEAPAQGRGRGHERGYRGRGRGFRSNRPMNAADGGA
ncbi:alba DNA/RNA-binding protein [Actinidia rufa]|uniref:Alba DNA/RNA-binding protein n=1 Tax=Actinidia rufa TaxID=165716 RepID=A0A7J0GI43_9ERIC|nr:alba DNA/RNA-binding protein [Actinidia rufa]